MKEEPSVTRDPRGPSLQRFSRAQAVSMLVAVLDCRYERSAWPCAVLAIAAFIFLIVSNRGAYTPRGQFGLANAVTSLRLALALVLALSAATIPARAAAAFTAGILALDALDGWLARARGEASAFGAHFDMETDAFLVLIVTLRLWLVEGYGAWVLCAGLLRYAYVLCLWLLPGTGREAPRSLLGRSAFAVLMVGLIAGLWNQGALGVWCVASGTLAVSASFARSFYFSYLAS
jgi:phosphatidylglycerophosphate synthase